MVSKYTFTTHRLAELTELRRFNFTTSEIYDQYHRLDFLMCMRHNTDALISLHLDNKRLSDHVLVLPLVKRNGMLFHRDQDPPLIEEECLVTMSR